jgi:PAS domain S-box-containing protein
MASDRKGGGAMNSPQSTIGEATSILDTVQEAYVRLDGEFHFTFINRAAEILLGASRIDLIGKTPWEVHPESAGTPLEEGFRRAKVENAIVSFENYYEPWQRWYAITAMPDSNGGFVVHFLDITEHKGAQLALQESEERQRHLFEHMQEGVAYCRMIFENGEPKDFIYLMVNEAFETLTHLTGVVGKRVTEVIPGIREADPELFQLYGRVALTGEPHKFEMYVKALSQWFSISVYSPEQQCFVAVFEVITERKQTEARLALQNERFRRIIEETDAGYFRIGIDGCYEEVNRAWVRMHGFSDKSEIVGRPFASVQVPEDLQKAEGIVGALLRGESVTGSEFSRLRRDGTVGYHTFSANPIVVDERIVGIEGFLIDTTDLKRAEHDRQQSDKRYRSLFDSMHEGVAVHRLASSDGIPDNYILLDVNRRYEEIVGVRREDVTNRLATDVYGLSAPPYLKEYASAVQTQCPLVFETHFKPMDKHFVISVAPMGDGLFATIFFDVTEQKKTDEAMRNFVTAIEQTTETILITDLDGTIQYCNPAFEKVTGYSKEEAIGQNPRFLKSGKHNAEFYGQLWTTITQGKVWTGHLINKKKDGSFYEEEATISPIRYGSGKIAGFVAVKRDVTERRQLEDQLRQAQKLESVGRLASGVAHDFNNLLTVIVGYSDFLLDALKGPDPLRSYAEEIKNAGERAASLTKQLLAFSRKQVIEPKVLDLNVTIRQSIPMLQRLIGEDMVLKTHLDASLGQIMADPDQIHQVIMNLVVNARDAMPHGGRLDIETTNVDLLAEDCAAIHPDAVPGPCVLMAVTDTGHGMDETTRQQIFEPFFTTKEVGRGTGLGLSTVYGIIRQSGGWIGVRSEVGVGTSFRVYLPQVDGLPLEEANRLPIPAERGVETILLVEDQKAVRGFTKAALEKSGYHVIEASSGDDALAIAQQHPGPIHLLLTDVVMPGMNGRELSEHLKELRPNLKVLFVSGYSADVIAHRGVVERGVALLSKPFSSAELAAKVREVLAQPS